MKTPDEFKKNLIACMDEAIEVAESGDAHDLMDFAHHAHARMSETLTYIQQLESSYSQVSKALCGKENATLEELLRAVDQVKQTKPGKTLICEITIDGEDILRKALDKTEVDGKTLAEWVELVKGYKQLEADLATVKRERDAAVADLRQERGCGTCRHEEAKKSCTSEDWFCHECLNDCPCVDCLQFSMWQWRGVCPENTEVKENG